MAETGYSEEEVNDTFEASRYGSLLSLEAASEPNGNGDSSTLLDHLGSNDPQFDQMADKIDLTNTINGLSEREKTIIMLKFYSELSQAEIAKRLGISQMHVSRLQRNALGRLKTSLGGRPDRPTGPGDH